MDILEVDSYGNDICDNCQNIFPDCLKDSEIIIKFNDSVIVECDGICFLEKI